MTTLAERLAPHLANLIHPGDSDTPPFPLAMVQFQTAQLPDGMQQEIAEEMGLPTPNLSLHFMEAVLALIEHQGIELTDKTKMDDLRAAAAANETKRNHTIELHCRCGTKLARLMVTDFDTDHPRVNGPELIRSLGAMNPDCTTKHRAR